MARLSGVKEFQRDVASALTKSVAAICGAVGTQPIPLADFPILTRLQAAMVAGIMHISGARNEHEASLPNGSAHSARISGSPSSCAKARVPR